MTATNDSNYSQLPFTGHSGVALNDHLRGQLGQIPRLPEIIQKQTAAALQKEAFAAKHAQEAAELQSARDQIAAIAAAQAQAAATKVTAQIPTDTPTDIVHTAAQTLQNWRQLLNH